MKQKFLQYKTKLATGIRKTCYIVNDQGQFKFLGKAIKIQVHMDFITTLA